MVRGDFTVPYRKKGFPAAIYYLSLVIVPVMFFFSFPLINLLIFLILLLIFFWSSHFMNSVTMYSS